MSASGTQAPESVSQNWLHSASARQARQTGGSQTGVAPPQAPPPRQPTAAPVGAQCGVAVRAAQSASPLHLSQRPVGSHTGVARAHSLDASHGLQAPARQIGNAAGQLPASGQGMGASAGAAS